MAQRLTPGRIALLSVALLAMCVSAVGLFWLLRDAGVMESPVPAICCTAWIILFTLFGPRILRWRSSDPQTRGSIQEMTPVLRMCGLAFLVILVAVALSQ